MRTDESHVKNNYVKEGNCIAIIKITHYPICQINLSKAYHHPAVFSYYLTILCIS
jgi:hypothetical protein